jgi:hypothetical protein
VLIFTANLIFFVILKENLKFWRLIMRWLILSLFLLSGCSLFDQVQTNIVQDIQGKSMADANVEYVRAVYNGNNSWTFHVTVAHPDTGWEDYADGWDVILPDGTVLKPDAVSPFTRLLLHPHETEQPFTRSQSGIVIPEAVTTVTVRAHDLIDAWGGTEVVIDLTQSQGDNYLIER